METQFSFVPFRTTWHRSWYCGNLSLKCTLTNTYIRFVGYRVWNMTIINILQSVYTSTMVGIKTDDVVQLRTFALIVSAQLFYASIYAWCKMSRTRQDINKHGVREAMWKKKNFTRNKSGKFVKNGELKRRKVCAKRLTVPRPKNNESENKKVNINSDKSKVMWDEGRRVVELGILAEGLQAYSDCEQPLQLSNI